MASSEQAWAQTARLVALLALGTAAWSCRPDNAPAALASTHVGSEIVLGSTVALGGSASFLGRQLTDGATAYLSEVNAAGGVHGRTLRLVSLDDGYDPARAIFNTQSLLVERDVFALFGFTGTPTSVKVVPLITRAHVPALGFFTGAEALRRPLRSDVFHVRDSYGAEAEAGIHYFFDALGLHKIAVVYQEDAFGQAVLAGVQTALKKRGAEPVGTTSMARGSMEVVAARDAVRSTGADGVMLVGTYAPLAKLVKSCHDVGYAPYFHTVSFVGSEAFAKELITTQHVAAEQFGHIVVTQVVPSPQDASLPAVAEFQALFGKHFPATAPNYVALEGFLNAKVLVEGLRRAGPDLSRAGFVHALESIHGFDVGIGRPLELGADDHVAMTGVFYSRLGPSGTFDTFDPSDVVKR
jgi:branched-chain amino acid transport system substrate-binding protein